MGTAALASDILHATSVALDARAVLILGPSGAGKSALALDLISRGMALISDDRTHVEATPDGLIASAPGPAGRGLIEARGVGLLAVAHVPRARVRLIVDLGKMAGTRLPEMRTHTILGQEIDLIAAGDLAHPAPVIHLMLQGGRVA